MWCSWCWNRLPIVSVSMSHKLQLWRVMDSSDWTSLGHVPVCPAPATSAFHQVCAFWTLGECFGHSTMLSFDHANSFLLLSSIHTLFGHEQLVYILKYPCLHQVLKGYFSVFSFESFAAFAFIFIFRIHFWENCLYVMICVEVYFFFPTWIFSCSTIIYCILTLYFLSMFIENQMTVYMWIYL